MVLQQQGQQQENQSNFIPVAETNKENTNRSEATSTSSDQNEPKEGGKKKHSSFAKTTKRIDNAEKSSSVNDIESLYVSKSTKDTEPSDDDNDDGDKGKDDTEAPRRIGGTYTQREFIFVLTAGILLTFNAGYVNGSCLSGLLNPTGLQQSVAGFTGVYTSSALALAEGDVSHFGFQFSMILSMIAGSAITSLINPRASQYRIEPGYGPAFLIGGIFLLTASLLAAFELRGNHLFFFAAAANGIQNGISSIYSANLIRSTHLTGTSTDIGLFIGQAIRGNFKNFWRLTVLVSLATAFWLGGVVSYFSTRHFTSSSLLFNSGLFFLIGCSLIYFLVHELHISVWSALFGTWMWKKLMSEMVEKKKKKFLVDGGGNDDAHSSDFFQSHYLSHVFNDIEKEGDEVTEQELLSAFQDAGVNVNAKTVKVLMKAADEDTNGRLSKAEWKKIARAVRKS